MRISRHHTFANATRMSCAAATLPSSPAHFCAKQGSTHCVSNSIDGLHMSGSLRAQCTICEEFHRHVGAVRVQVGQLTLTLRVALCSARPYEKVSRHGVFTPRRFTSSCRACRFSVDSSSLIPPAIRMVSITISYSNSIDKIPASN